ncbi:unnamed protein product [Lampetra planeri]
MGSGRAAGAGRVSPAAGMAGRAGCRCGGRGGDPGRASGPSRGSLQLRLPVGPSWVTGPRPSIPCLRAARKGVKRPARAGRDLPFRVPPLRRRTMAGVGTTGERGAQVVDLHAVSPGN